MEVLLAPADGQTNNDPVRNSAYSFSDGFIDCDLLPSISSITACAEFFVEGIADLIENLGYACIDLPRQVSSDYCEVVDESITRSGSKPLKPQDLVLRFGRSDEVLGLLGKPLGAVRRQNDGRPMKRRSDKRFAFAAVL